VKYLLTQVIKL